MQPEGICPKCLEFCSNLTKHHIFPKRHFGKGNSNPSKLLLCKDCHWAGENAIEKYIPRNLKLSKEQYIEIHKAWFRDNPITVFDIPKDDILCQKQSKEDWEIEVANHVNDFILKKRSSGYGGA